MKNAFEKKRKNLKKKNAGYFLNTILKNILRLSLIKPMVQILKNMKIYNKDYTLSCFKITSIKKFVRTLSTFGTKIEENAGTVSIG